MATEEQPITVEGALVVKYDVTDAAIAELKERFKGVAFDTPAAYDEGKKALAVLRDLRGKIEKRRKDLKADSLAFGRKVDAVARHFTGLIAEIEDPLQSAKALVDEAEAKRKREEEKAELLALEAKLKADREAEEAKAKEAREAEEKRLAEERARIAEQERVLNEQRRAQEEERRREDARIKAEREELDRRQAEIAAKEAAARREQEAKDAAARAAEKARAAAEEQAKEEARLEALRPDIEKVHDYASRLLALAGEALPEVASLEAKSALAWAIGRVEKISEGLAMFKGKTS